MRIRRDLSAVTQLTGKTGKLVAGDLVAYDKGLLGLVRAVSGRSLAIDAYGINKTELDKAIEGYAAFTGMEPDEVEVMEVPERAQVVFPLGRLLAVEYEAVRGYQKDGYRHAFKKTARPQLASSHDGRQLVVLGGAYRITDHGIVDQ